MRSGQLLSLVIVAVMVIAAVPCFFSASSDADADPDPNDYVDPTKTISFTGYARYDASSNLSTELILFIVYSDGTGKKYYIDANDDDTLIKVAVNDTSSADESKHYYFEIQNVPLIIESSGAQYYICAFTNFKIQTVSSEIDPDSKSTLFPDQTWSKGGKTWEAWQIKNSLWTGSVGGESYAITGGYNTETKEFSGDQISLDRAEGTVNGHVNGIIGNNTSNLDDVLVQFYRGDDFVASTRTDGHGDYSIRIATGDYKVTYSRGNYTCEPVDVTVTEGTTTVSDVTMTLVLDNAFFGFDLAHFLAIIGGIVCAFIIVISIIFQYRRIKMKKSGNDWILDDLDEDDDE